MVTDPAELEYFGTDVYARGEPLLAVLQPDSAERLAAAVGELTAAGPVIPAAAA